MIFTAFLPTSSGFCILDLSKLLMYQFHYDYVRPKWGDRAELCFTDTDSLTYHIRTEDVYTDIAEDSSRFDFSDYPTNHPLFSETNKKVIGKFKDELNGNICFFSPGHQVKPCFEKAPLSKSFVAYG